MNDINPKRTKALLKNVENFGLKNIVVTNNEPHELKAAFPNYFDRVLVDAPCSGEGMFRRDSRLTIAWRRNFHPSICVPLQSELLAEAAAMVVPGGYLVYSTCTFSSEENEGQVKEFLKRHPEFQLLEVLREGISPGRGRWVGDPLLDKTGRIWPHHSRGEGQFVAYLQKVEEGSRKEVSQFNYIEPGNGELVPYWDFCAEVGIDPPKGRLWIREDDLFLLPESLPNLAELNPVRIGLFLGELRHNRFFPSHPFALALERQEAKRQLELASDGYEIIRYLRGETFLANETKITGNGWILVTTNGFPLGWANRVNNLVKNNYPAAWRLR